MKVAAHCKRLGMDSNSFQLDPSELAQYIREELEGKNLLPLWTKEEEAELIRSCEEEEEQERKDWERQQAKSKEQYDQWIKDHPNYCKVCGGWGEIHEPGGWINPPLDYNCEACLCCGECPHCGSGLEVCDETEETEQSEPDCVVSPNPAALIEGDEAEYIGRCNVCGWEYGAEGLVYPY